MARRAKAAQQAVTECRRTVTVDVRSGVETGYYEGVGSARCENCPRGFGEKSLFMTRNSEQATRLAASTQAQIDSDMDQACKSQKKVQ